MQMVVKRSLALTKIAVIMKKRALVQMTVMVKSRALMQMAVMVKSRPLMKMVVIKQKSRSVYQSLVEVITVVKWRNLHQKIL